MWVNYEKNAINHNFKKLIVNKKKSTEHNLFCTWLTKYI